MHKCDERHIEALDMAAAVAADGADPRHEFSRHWSKLPAAEKEA